MRRKPIEDGDTGAEYNDEGSVEGTKTPRMNQWEEEGEKRTSRSFFFDLSHFSWKRVQVPLSLSLSLSILADRGPEFAPPRRVPLSARPKI